MKKREKIEIIFDLVFVALNVMIVAYFNSNNLITLCLLLLVAVTGLIFWKDKTTLSIFILGAILGPLSELVAIYFGAWNYTNPNFFTIPIWLPILWGSTTSFFHRTSLIIANLVRSKY